MSKWHNVPCCEDGIKFDSGKERDRYRELKMLEQAGLIEELAVHKSWELQPSFILQGKRIRAITFAPDFYYLDNERGKYVVEDVKGLTAPLTKEFQIKAKMLAYMEGHIVEIVRM